MGARPTSVTIIACILIGLSGISLVSSFAMQNDPKVKELMAQSPMPVPAQFTMLYLGLAVTIVSGIGMLLGGNWARWLYVVWSAIGMIVGLATSPMKLMMLPGFLIYLLFVVLLFQPAANHYFARIKPPDA